MNIQEIRSKFPQYSDLSDGELIAGLHKKYYADMPYEEFAGKIGTEPKIAPTLTNMDKVKRGMADPIEGAAQLLYNVVPKSVQDAGNSLNNWIADKTGLVARIPDAGLNALIQNNEKDYQAQRTAQGEDGLDGWRIMGNVASPANVLAATQAMKAAPLVSKVAGTMAGNVAAGAIGAGAQGAMMPSYSDDYSGDKASQIISSAAVGGLLPFAGKLLPKRTQEAKALRDAGIDVPVGSAMGGFAKSLEDKATSIPLLGDAINANRSKAIEQFNIATINKALAPIGQTLSKGVQAGHDAIEEAGKRVSDAYNSLLPKLKVKADSQFSADMAQIKQMAQNLPDAEFNQFNRIIANEVDGRFTQAGLMTGETMKQVESKLGQLAKGYGRSEGYEKKQLADALRQVQDNLRTMVERNNPIYAPQLRKINQSYAALQRPERAASYVGAENGVFSPAHLLSAVKATDPSLRHKAFSKGNALMQDWAETAKVVLPNKIPDSGTATRLMMGGGALGGLSYLSPEIAGLGALATAAYMPGGRAVASGLLNASEEAAKLISNRAPYAAPLFTPIGYGLLGSSSNPN